MKNNKDNIRCFKFFGKFAWQNDKKYYAFLILNIIVNSLSPFVTILGTQYLIDEIADESKRNMFWMYRPPKVRPKNLTIGGRYFYGKIQL